MPASVKRKIAANMAAELWEKLMKSTEPSKRRVYALRYEFWANVRDQYDPHEETGECER